MALADLQGLVVDLLRDDAGRIDTTERDRAIGLAVAQYSRDMPRVVVEDVTATGVASLPLPAAWVPGRTYLASLEYPVGEFPVSYLDPEFLGVVATPAGEEIRLIGAILAEETVRATIHIPHTLDAETDTIPAMDREPLASLAASILLDQLSRLYANEGDSTISADAVDRRSKADVYRSLAKAARQRYYDALAIDPNRRPAAGVAVNLSLPSSQGRDRLTHPARLR